MVVLESEAIDRLRSMTPREAFEDLEWAVFDQLVEAGVLTWDQIEEYERY